MDTVILSFTNCAEDQFTCSDGLCVNIDKRLKRIYFVFCVSLGLILTWHYVDATVNQTAMTLVMSSIARL